MKISWCDVPRKFYLSTPLNFRGDYLAAFSPKLTPCSSSLMSAIGSSTNAISNEIQKLPYKSRSFHQSCTKTILPKTGKCTAIAVTGIFQAASRTCL